MQQGNDESNMSREKVPKEHIELMMFLKRTLTTDAFEDMKVVVKADVLGGFQDAELEKIKNVRDMLSELEARGVIKVGCYRKLKDIMEMIGNEAVIEEINRTEELLYEKGGTADLVRTDGPLQAANKIEKILRARYRTTGSFVQIIPWVGDDMKPISDIYTKLRLENTDNKGQQLKSYGEIFLEKTKEGDLIQRIIVAGIAGVGKSTLIDKMAYDWAMGEALKEYKLVFVLKMFALEESSELIDAIFNQLVDEDASLSKDDLRSYITTNPEKIVILCDGFDEFKTINAWKDSQSPGDVSRIFNRKILRGSCVVVTTRPSHYHNLVNKHFIEKPFVHVKVLGFNGDDIEKYIIRFFSEEQDKAERLVQKIKSSDVLSDLAKGPMLLLLMCILWREQSTIPDTMYRLYTEALMYIFKRKELTPDDSRQVVRSIGENALDDLLSPHQFLSFKEGDFEDQAFRSALKAGVLTSQRVLHGLDTRHSVSFIHRTFQEYCAAIFFQSLLGTNEEELSKNLDRIETIAKNGLDKLQYFLRFCCGDNQSCTNKVLNLMQKIFGQQYIIDKEFPYTCYFEGQFEDLPAVDLIPERMFIKDYSSDGWRSLCYYLEHVIAADQMDRENTVLGKVTLLKISGCNLESIGKVLGEAMSRMPKLPSFELDPCSGNPASMGYILSSFVSSPKLKEMYIFLKVNADQGDRDMRTLDRRSGQWLPLKTCGTLIEYKEGRLSLVGSYLKCSQLSDILSQLVTKEDLSFIELSNNPYIGFMECTWAQYLKTGLQALWLDSCSVLSTDIEALAKSLSINSTTFSELRLADNPSLGGNAVAWAAYLGQLPQLKRLDLSNCLLTGLDIEALAKSIGNIQVLSLSGNLELKHSVASWAPLLRHFKHLELLYLVFIDFTSDDEAFIREELRHMPNCKVYFDMNA